MMAIAALIAWVLTASIGVYMLRTWVTRGGLRRQRATGVGVPPAVVFGHASAALIGLAIWAGFVKTKWDPLAWLGVVMITGAIGLGVCTVTLWTPYPVVVPPEGGKGGPGGWLPPKGGPGGWVPPKGGPGGWVPPKGGPGDGSPRKEKEKEKKERQGIPGHRGLRCPQRAECPPGQMLTPSRSPTR